MSEAATTVELLTERIARNVKAKELSTGGHESRDALIASDQGLIAILDAVPNKPKTPISSFRIPTELKQAAQVVAKERGEDLTAVVIRAFEQYVKKGSK